MVTVASPTPLSMAKQLLAILHCDREEHLLKIDDYLHGRHDDPYMPHNADDEYRLLARRSVSNWMGLLVGTPAQAMFVDGYRRNSAKATGVATKVETPEWLHWERSRLAGRQGAIYRGALAYGHSFTVTELDSSKRPVTKGLSALKTAALFEDPANDETPFAALTITAWPSKDDKTPGKASLWDGTYKYPVTFRSLQDDKGVTVGTGVKHGASECPVTRFTASVDLEGRTVGVVEPMIPLQNRINQTVFDLLVAQTYGSFKVRYVTGMAPPLQMEPVYENPDDTTSDIIDFKPVLDSNGNPKPLPMNHNARRFLFAEDPDAKFGSLDGTPLDGYINSIDMSIRHFAAVSQTPPHYLLGQIANLSAEALIAAETSLSRKVEEFRTGFGESWQRVFRLAAELTGDAGAAEDFNTEVLWRDMESKSIAQAADALGKLKEQLEIPAQGLWRRVPNVTEPELNEWERLAKEQQPEQTMAEAIHRATVPDQNSSVPLDLAPSSSK